MKNLLTLIVKIGADMVYLIQLSILLLALVNCVKDYNNPNVPDHIEEIEIPYFSKESEKCNSGSEFETASGSSYTLLQRCHDVGTANFQECKDKAREACQRVAKCTKSKFLEILFYDQNELKLKLEKAETSDEMLTIVSEAVFSKPSGPNEENPQIQCFKSETLEFQSFVTTYRVKEDAKD